MAITFQEAIELTNKGILICCPICHQALDIDLEDKTMTCAEHGGEWVINEHITVS
ncbi:hypothetical protein [Desulforegula conservatrix]|uniref:hypothetical protein n=1 Tax=Desulforegula conservatrix TaxID=153026 RepID=UPI0004121925|nr:hypothetical protein [Desulforegula conservatrix]